MSSHGTTKDHILRLISHGTNNLSSISEELKLAPSTVSKHLHDLEESGFIVLKDSSQTKKWKYYEINPSYKHGLPAPVRKTAKDLMPHGYRIALSVTAIITVIGIVSYIYLQSTGAVYIPISLTDPPQVPLGTQALYINYSSLSVHIHNGISSQWISANASGRIDLMGIINASQIIGEVEIRPGSVADSVRFNITSASIIIGNVTYPVAVTDKNITAKINGGIRLNSSSALLLDFTPVVMPAYLHDSTLFVMVPSLRVGAVTSPVFNQRSAILGHITYGPGYSIMFRKYPVKFRERGLFVKPADLNVMHTALMLHGNQTLFAINMYNSGNTSLTVKWIMLKRTSPYEMQNYTVTASPMPMAPGKIVQYNQTGPSIIINTSEICNKGNLAAGVIIIKTANAVNQVVISHMDRCTPGIAIPAGLPPSAAFVVEGNGTLAPFIFQPAIAGTQKPSGSPGYTLQPGSSAEFSYNGTLIANGFAEALPSGTYNVVVLTSSGIAITNVTST